MKLFGYQISLGKAEAKAIGDPGSTLAQIIERLHSGSKSGVAVTTETALEVAAAFACARVIAEGLAQVPFKVYREVSPGVREVARDHALYKLLSRKPNEWQTSFEFREMLGLHLAFCGGGYVFVNRVRGKIVELLPYTPKQVTVKREGWVIRYFINTNNGGQIEIPASQMWHLRGPSWDGVMGLDVVKLAREALGLALATEEHSARMFSNGARLGGVLTTDGSLKEDQVAALRKSWEETHTGVNNAYKTAILWGGLKWQTLGMQSDVAQLIEQRRFQVGEICRAFRVMPIMIGFDDKNATYASAEQMFLSHVVHTLGPWYARIEQSADAFLLTDAEFDEGYYTHFVAAGLLRGAHKDRAEYYAKALGAGGSPAWMTQDEVRGLEELNAMGGEAADLPIATNVGAKAPDPSADPQADANAKHLQQLTEVKSLLTDLQNKPAPAHTINLTTAPVTVKSGDTHVTLPEGCVQVVAEITTPEVKTGNVIITNEAAPAPTVENHVHLPEAKAGPQEVAIVSLPGVDVNSLPERRTTSEIERDRSGNIISTTQVEKDGPA